MQKINQLRLDCAIKQKKGLHIILASVLIWMAITCVHLTTWPILTKNLFTFVCAAFLLPTSFIISKLIKVDFQNQANPLTELGIIFSVNQVLYLLIAMWIYPTIPDKMLMVITIIFGAHLLPYGWLYRSQAYFIFSCVVPVLALIVGLNFNPSTLAEAMIVVEGLFYLALVWENKKLRNKR